MRARAGCNGMERTVRELKKKKEWVGTGVCYRERGTCWYKSSLSHAHSHISCVFLCVGGFHSRVSVFKRQTVCFKPLQLQRTDNSPGCISC